MIVVMGLGFVGLSTALGFYEKGRSVVGLDLDRTIVDSLNRGNVPFFDRTISDSLSKINPARISFTTELSKGQNNAVEAIFICVGTPSLGDGDVDLSQVYSAFEEAVRIARDSTGDTLIILKSTAPAGTMNTVTTEMLRRMGAEALSGVTFLNNPEFLREGVALDDFINSDRIVIGTNNGKPEGRAEELYSGFDVPVTFVTYNTAEFVKYSSNATLAGLISIANELSLIASAVGDVDIKKAFELLHQDRRWFGKPGAMSKYLFPGCGFGGYCLPKDVDGMIALATRHEVEPNLLRAIQSTNEKIAAHHVAVIAEQFGREKRFGVLGLAFKENTDDVRNTPAAKMIAALLDHGATRIYAHDPMAIDNFCAAHDFPISYERNLDKIIDVSDVLLIVTAWPEYKVSPAKYADKSFVDLRLTF